MVPVKEATLQDITSILHLVETMARAIVSIVILIEKLSRIGKPKKRQRVSPVKRS
jgi:hypothetical protein